MQILGRKLEITGIDRGAAVHCRKSIVFAGQAALVDRFLARFAGVRLKRLFSLRDFRITKATAAKFIHGRAARFV